MKIFLMLINCFLFSSGLFGETVLLNFDQDQPGAAPKNFQTALTGKGKPGKWLVMNDSSAPSKPNTLVQQDADSTSYRFPLCIYTPLKAKDVVVTVKFKPFSGDEDKAGGIVWRYQDPNNYYIVRANALEGNVVLYKVQDGKRTDLPLKAIGRTYGKKVPVPKGKWSTLSITAKGNLFSVALNGEKLYEVEDTTFPDEGQVGLWTKADSVTYFDNLEISTAP